MAVESDGSEPCNRAPTRYIDLLRDRWIDVTLDHAAGESDSDKAP